MSNGFGTVKLSSRMLELAGLTSKRYGYLKLTFVWQWVGVEHQELLCFAFFTTTKCIKTPLQPPSSPQRCGYLKLSCYGSLAGTHLKPPGIRIETLLHHREIGYIAVSVVSSPARKVASPQGLAVTGVKSMSPAATVGTSQQIVGCYLSC